MKNSYKREKENNSIQKNSIEKNNGVMVKIGKVRWWGWRARTSS